jgi:hypothetical protein
VNPSREWHKFSLLLLSNELTGRAAEATKLGNYSFRALDLIRWHRGKAGTIFDAP